LSRRLTNPPTGIFDSPIPRRRLARLTDAELALADRVRAVLTRETEAASSGRSLGLSQATQATGARGHIDGLAPPADGAIFRSRRVTCQSG